MKALCNLIAHAAALTARGSGEAFTCSSITKDRGKESPEVGLGNSLPVMALGTENGSKMAPIFCSCNQSLLESYAEKK